MYIVGFEGGTRIRAKVLNNLHCYGVLATLVVKSYNSKVNIFSKIIKLLSFLSSTSDLLSVTAG